MLGIVQKNRLIFISDDKDDNEDTTIKIFVRIQGALRRFDKYKNSLLYLWSCSSLPDLV